MSFFVSFLLVEVMDTSVLGLPIQTWLGLTVVGAIISTLGSLVGVALKDYFFARSLENWKQERTLEQLFQRYRDPLRLSARELALRLLEILDDYPTVFLKESVLLLKPVKQEHNSTDDPYYRRYKLMSTSYRLCAFLGWLELFRQDITFLHLDSNANTRAFEVAVSRCRSDLADGHINDATDWEAWKDTLIFREELRAIGEAMLETRGDTRTVLGYGKFCDLVDGATDGTTKFWSGVTFNFLLDMQVGGKDFRKKRLQKLVVHLIELIELLSGPVEDKRLLDAREKWKA